MVESGPIMFQAQKLMADTHVASTRFTLLLVLVSGVVAVLTSLENHSAAGAVWLSRKLLPPKQNHDHNG
ncbi:hypothetical protein MMOR_44680 [Mycolicibacterium moriokaense]|uniref:Uncharacterized protein n=1 Tax=Mycolicibacterium moriokaense TaxID=39691 RepID=A0AAD1HDP9_9MYCO|nr:hypothetical protein MMOR_44680 [Mycolicibacterium moriokaense]